MTSVRQVPAFPTPEAAIAYGALTSSIQSGSQPVPSGEVNFRVLLVEGEGAGDSLLVEAVRAEIPNADVLRTPGAMGALALGGLYDFDLLLIATSLPENLGGEILRIFAEHNPNAEVLVAGAEVPGEIPDGLRVTELQSLDNPIECIQAIRACRDRVLGPPIEDTGGNFVVVLSRHSPMEVVQFKCMSGGTTTLDFLRPTGIGGRMWFEKGEIIHAETGSVRGEAALIEMMLWPSGSIVEVNLPPPAERTIDVPWTALLMNVAQAADERAAGWVGKRED